jgi:hypothetical protein
MRIPLTRQRRRIDEIAAPAIDRSIIWSTVGALHGITIVEPFADPSDRYTCYWYVFKDEDWYQALESTKRSREIEGLLLTAGISFLTGHGYVRLSEPEDHAVVAYQSSAYPASVRHYGRLLADGRVRSKFGTGYVFEHALDRVPNCYGDRAVFFQKRENNV